MVTATTGTGTTPTAQANQATPASSSLGTVNVKVEVRASGWRIACGKEKVVVVSPNLVPRGCHFALVDDREKLWVHAHI